MRQTGDEEHAEAVLRALNHHLRRRIMRIFVVEKVEVISPTEASHLLRAPLSNVSYHFRVLAKNRALDLARERPANGSIKHLYRLNRAVAKMPMVAEILIATRDLD